MLKNYQRKLTLVRLTFLLFFFIGGMVIMRYFASRITAYSQSKAILDLRMGYTFKECQDYLLSLGIEGRKIYGNEFFYIDFIYLIIYNIFYFSALLYLLRFIKSKKLKLIILLPLCSFLFDLGENVLIHQMVNSYPDISQKICKTANTFTILKFISVYGSLVFIILLVALLIKQCIRANRKQKR